MNNQQTPVIACMYHEGYFINNFCKKQECSLPMCAECVKIHADEHSESQSPSDFDLFSNCLHEKQDEQLTSMNLWGVDVQETYDLQNEIIQNEDIQRKKLLEAKQQLTRVIEDYFRQMENEILIATSKSNQELQKQIKAQHRIDYFEWQKDQKTLEKLKSDKCLGPIIKMYQNPKNTPLQIYQQRHKDHLEFIQSIKTSLKQVVINDKLPLIIPILQQYVSLKETNIQPIQNFQQQQSIIVSTQNLQSQNLQNQQILQNQQNQNLNTIYSNPNNLQSKVIQPFSMISQINPIIQPMPMQIIQPILPQQQFIQQQFTPQASYPQPSYPQPSYPQPQYPQTPIVQSIPQQFLQQSTPPRILNPTYSSRIELDQPIQVSNSKQSMAQRYYDQMNKNDLSIK